MSRPLNVIRPPVGAMNFDSMLKQVVLPAPFGPMSAWIVPRSNAKGNIADRAEIPEALAEAFRDENIVHAHSRRPAERMRFPQ